MSELPELLDEYRNTLEDWPEEGDVGDATSRYFKVRSAIESFVARLESENERLKETALTPREARWLIDYWESGNEPRGISTLIGRLRRISSTSEETRKEEQDA